MKHFVFILPVLLAAFISGCTSPAEITEDNEVTEVNFQTEDGYTIYGSYYANSGPGVILLHGLGRDRHVWSGFAKELQDNGYAVLSLDMRGHGQSTIKEGETRLWTTFSNQDFNDMVYDVIASEKFLRNKQIKNVNIIGSSIGANIAFGYGVISTVVDYSEIDGIVLLSPGLDYRGVRTDNIINPLPILIVASEGDTEAVEGANLVRSNSELAPIKILKIYPGGAHGTNMFQGTDFDKLILNFLDQIQTNVPIPEEVRIEYCGSTGGIWKRFSSACADSCTIARNPTGVCAQVITWSCDCGPGRCWNGNSCEPD